MKHHFLVVVLGMAAASAAAQKPKKSWAAYDYSDLQHHTLTMPELNRYFQTNGDLSKLEAANPGVSELADPEDESPAPLEQRAASNKRVMSVLRRHHFSPHEFSIVNFSVLNSILCIESTDGLSACVREAHINQANVLFVTKHLADIKRLVGDSHESEDGGGMFSGLFSHR